MPLQGHRIIHYPLKSLSIEIPRWRATSEGPDQTLPVQQWLLYHVVRVCRTPEIWPTRHVRPPIPKQHA